MAMNDTLHDVTNEIVRRRGEKIRSLFEAQIAAAAEHLLRAHVPKAGDIAPDFSLSATDGKPLTLDEILSDAPVVLTFYRGSWCSFCNAALKVWQRALPDLGAIGVRLFAIAPETLEVCREFKSAAEIDYELLSDTGHVAADAYGLTFELPALARETLASFGKDVGALNGNGEWSVPVTATFAIGTDKRIQFADCGPDYRRRADPEDVLRVFGRQRKRGAITAKMFDVVVVGAGQAGLAISYFLKRDGCHHVVFERGRVGETWRTQRWDSFALNTPNSVNDLPGLPYDGPQPDGFWLCRELIAFFERYAKNSDLPVRTRATVTSVERFSDGASFQVKLTTDREAEKTVLARSVVIASGILQTPKLPGVSTQLPPDIVQLHTADYRNPASLPPGAVVVVGSAQSGCQITEDLLEGGRQVYLCTSKVGRIPRRYRGRDTVLWLKDMGFHDVTVDELTDKSIIHAAQPQISGVGRYGHTVSLQQMARNGVVVLGRLLAVEDGCLIVGDDAAEHARFADKKSAQYKRDIDAYIERAGITPPPLEDDLADTPDPNVDCVSPIRRLDLKEANVSTVIWATGFTADFGWIHLPVLDQEGMPAHRRGVSAVPGLYFIGFPWLHSRKSGLIRGVEEDAGHIAGVIAERLTARLARAP